VISGAPVIALVTFAVLGVIQYFIFKAYYNHQLSARDSIIASKDSEIALLDRQLGIGSMLVLPDLKPQEEPAVPSIVPSVEQPPTVNKPQGPDHSIELNLNPFFGRLFNLPKPSIIRSEYHLQSVARGDDDIFRPLPWTGDWDWVALVGTFKNDPIPPPADSRESVRPTGSAKEVVARINYVNSPW
jgi:hypothetical protein